MLPNHINYMLTKHLIISNMTNDVFIVIYDVYKRIINDVFVNTVKYHLLQNFKQINLYTGYLTKIVSIYCYLTECVNFQLPCLWCKQANSKFTIVQTLFNGKYKALEMRYCCGCFNSLYSLYYNRNLIIYDVDKQIN